MIFSENDFCNNLICLLHQNQKLLTELRPTSGSQLPVQNIDTSLIFSYDLRIVVVATSGMVPPCCPTWRGQHYCTPLSACGTCWADKPPGAPHCCDTDPMLSGSAPRRVPCSHAASVLQVTSGCTVLCCMMYIVVEGTAGWNKKN